MRCRYKQVLSDNVKVDVTTGEYCADLPAENTKVMVEYYPAIGKIVVTASNMLKRAKHFKNADDLACYLLDSHSKPKRKPATASERIGNSSSKNTTVKNAESISSACDNVSSDSGVTNLSGVYFDDETGEVFTNSRTPKSLHLTWKRWAKEIIASYEWDKCLFLTCTLARKPTYSEMNRIATSFINRLKKQYKDEFKAIHKALEPCDDGSWHVHYLACFHDIPTTFNRWASRWWARQQKYENPMQIAIRKISSQDDLIQTAKYLDPTSPKKEHRIPFYPKNCQCLRGYGDFSAPATAICSFETAKKIVGDEMPTKRKNVRVIDADTNIELYYRIEYHFTSDIIAYWLERCYDMSADIHTADTPPVQSLMPAPPEKSYWEDTKCTERNTALWQDYKYANTERMYG